MKYDAFISYRHLEKDMYVAKKVHKALETAKIPKKIQKQIGRKKINRVFRDQEELPIGSDLGSNIESALQQAEFLIVICSPKTQESYWVMKEIDTFISMHGRENILAVLVEGEPAESFPPQLLTDENGNPVEPLAADVRGDKKSEIKHKLKTESLRLAASILHVDYDDLKQRHRERQMKKTIGIVTGVASILICLAVAFGLYNAYNLNKINAEYQAKLKNESKVLAAQSLEVLKAGDRQTAAILALEGLPVDDDRPFVPESMYALSQALDCYDSGVDYSSDKLLTHNIQVQRFTEKIDGTRVISVDSVNTVYVWDLESGEKLYEIPIGYNEYGFTDSVYEIGFSSQYAIVVGTNGLKAYDDEGNEVYAVNVPDDDYVKGAYIGKNNDVAVMATGNKVQVIDTSNGNIIKEYENHLDIEFSNDMVIDRDMKYVAVNHSDISQKGSIPCTIYNLENDEYVDATIKENCILDITFTVDNQLAVGSINEDELLGFSSCQFYIQKIDVNTGADLWSNQFNYAGGLSNSSYAYISSTFTEINGEECGRLSINGTKDAHILDLTTGEEVYNIASDDYIQKAGFNGDGSYVIIGTSDGKITLYPTDPSKAVTDNVIDVCQDGMSDFDMRNGCLVARRYRSPDLITMKFNKDESMLYENEIDRKISGIPDVSPDGKTYIISSSNGGDDFSYTYSIVDAKTGTVTNSFVVPNPDYKKAKYADEDTVIVPCTSGEVYKYIISKDKLTSEAYYEGYTIESTYSQNGKYLLTVDDRDFTIIQMSDQKVIAEGTNSSNIMHDAVITNDGKTIYYINIGGNYAVEKYDVEKKKSQQLVTEYRTEIVRISNDNQKLLTVSNDGMLRVYNVEDMECTDELSFYATSYTGLVQFSDDDTMLYLQGADLYFKIYDLEKDKYVLKFAEQSNEYDYCQYDQENNRLIISNYVGMSIIDLDCMGVLSYIEDGRAYIPQTENIIEIHSKQFFAFKFKNLDELIAEAKELYGDQKLTDVQKLEYHITE